MKFGNQFEIHKIPDWYTEYINYNELKRKITEFKTLKKRGEVKQLKGYYMINKSGQLYCIDFIKTNQPETPKQQENERNELSANSANAGGVDYQQLSFQATTRRRVNSDDAMPGANTDMPLEKARALKKYETAVNIQLNVDPEQGG